MLSQIPLSKSELVHLENIKELFKCSLGVCDSPKSSTTPSYHVQDGKVHGLCLQGCSINDLPSEFVSIVLKLKHLRTINLRGSNLSYNHPYLVKIREKNPKLVVLVEPSTTLLVEEHLALVELENSLNASFPVLQWRVPSSSEPGVFVRDKRVIGISFVGLGLTSPPSNIVSLLESFHMLEEVNLKSNNFDDIQAVQRTLNDFLTLPSIFLDHPDLTSKHDRVALDAIESLIGYSVTHLKGSLDVFFASDFPTYVSEEGVITHLGLRSCKLLDLCDELLEVFSGLKSLQFLDIRNNQIKEIITIREKALLNVNALLFTDLPPRTIEESCLAVQAIENCLKVPVPVSTHSVVETQVPMAQVMNGHVTGISLAGLGLSNLDPVVKANIGRLDNLSTLNLKGNSLGVQSSVDEWFQDHISLHNIFLDPPANLAPSDQTSIHLLENLTKKHFRAVSSSVYELRFPSYHMLEGAVVGLCFNGCNITSISNELLEVINSFRKLGFINFRGNDYPEPTPIRDKLAEKPPFWKTIVFGVPRDRVLFTDPPHSLHPYDWTALTQLENELVLPLPLLPSRTYQVEKEGIEVMDNKIIGISLFGVGIAELSTSLVTLVFLFKHLRYLNLKNNPLVDKQKVRQSLANHPSLRQVFTPPSTRLTKFDREVVDTLEKKIGVALTELAEKVYQLDVPGYHIKEGAVVGLSLTNCNLTVISEGLTNGIANLDELESINLRKNDIVDIPLATANLFMHASLKKVLIFTDPPKPLLEREKCTLIDLQKSIDHPLPSLHQTIDIHKTETAGFQFEGEHITTIALPDFQFKDVSDDLVELLLQLSNLQIVNLRRNPILEVQATREKLLKHPMIREVFIDPPSSLSKVDRAQLVVVEDLVGLSLPVIQTNPLYVEVRGFRVLNGKVTGISLYEGGLTTFEDSLGEAFLRIPNLQFLNLRENNLSNPRNAHKVLIPHKSLKQVATIPVEPVVKIERRILAEMENTLERSMTLTLAEIISSKVPGLEIQENHITGVCFAGMELASLPDLVYELLFKLRKLDVVNFKNNQVEDVPNLRQRFSTHPTLKRVFTDHLFTLPPKEFIALTEIEFEIEQPLPLLEEIPPTSITRGYMVDKSQKKVLGLSLAKSPFQGIVSGSRRYQVIPSSVAMSITKFNDLKTLNLNDNNLIRLSHLFRRLKNLEHAYLSGNPFLFPPKQSYILTEEDGAHFINDHLNHRFTAMFIPQTARASIGQPKKKKGLTREDEKHINDILNLTIPLKGTVPHDFSEEYRVEPKNTLVKLLLTYQISENRVIQARIARQLIDITVDLINIAKVAVFQNEIQKISDRESHYQIKQALQTTLRRLVAYRHPELNLPSHLYNQDVPQVIEGLLHRLDQAIENNEPPTDQETMTLFNVIILFQGLKKYLSEEKIKELVSHLLKLRFHLEVRKVGFIREAVEGSLKTLVPPPSEGVEAPLIKEVRFIDEVEQLIGIPLMLDTQADRTQIIRAEVAIEDAHITTLRINRGGVQTIPETVANLTQLRILDLKENDLEALPDSLFTIESLEEVDLYRNEFNVLDEQIGQLINLRILDIESNYLTKLPDTIGNLVNLEQLKVSDNKLNTLPETISNLTNLNMLYLDYNNISSLPDEIGRISSLEQLSLRNNAVETLPDSIGKLKTLKEIDLQFNHLTELPLSFSNLIYLQNLKLRNNRLSQLPKTITQLYRLEQVDLEGNQIQVLPESIGDLKKLRVLNLDSNQLKNLPDSFGSLFVLERLSIVRNELRLLPETFGNLESLEELNLYNNDLESLPDTFGHLPNLRSLNLSCNRIERLPTGFGSLKRLEILELHSNKIGALPFNFGYLRKLKRVDLGDNRLRALPDSIGMLSELLELNVRVNQLKELPETFCELNLRKLNISHNQIRILGSEIEKMQDLQEIFVQFNELNYLPTTIGKLKQLENIQAYSNDLETLPESLSELSHLRYLHLYDNRLSSIPDIFAGLEKLVELDLHHNNLTSLPPSLANLPNLDFINLEQNNFTELPEFIGLYKGQGCTVLIDAPRAEEKQQRCSS